MCTLLLSQSPVPGLGLLVFLLIPHAKMLGCAARQLGWALLGKGRFGEGTFWGRPHARSTSWPATCQPLGWGMGAARSRKAALSQPQGTWACTEKGKPRSTAVLLALLGALGAPAPEICTYHKVCSKQNVRACRGQQSHAEKQLECRSCPRHTRYLSAGRRSDFLWATQRALEAC